MSISKTKGMDELMTRPLSDAELDRATAEMATPLDARSRERGSLLVFACGGELLAVQAKEVAKVVPRAVVRRVPHRTNKVFKGLCNTDGELLLCVDLEQSLGLPAAAEDTQHVRVVIGVARDRWAFLVDRIVGVIEVDQSALQPAPATVTQARAGCVVSLAPTPEGVAGVIDLGRLSSMFRGAVS